MLLNTTNYYKNNNNRARFSLKVNPHSHSRQQFFEGERPKPHFTSDLTRLTSMTPKNICCLRVKKARSLNGSGHFNMQDVAEHCATNIREVQQNRMQRKDKV